MTDTTDAPVRAKLNPLFDYVVVKELDADKVRKSGIVMPDTLSSHDTPPCHAIVVAVGPGLDWWEGQGIEMPVSPGDHVAFPRTAGTYIELEEERLLALRVGQIIATVE
jgi:chaperonin GroES